MSKSEVLLVMVHLYEAMPDPGKHELNIKWKQFSDQLAHAAAGVTWPVLYQLDFAQKKHYDKLSNLLTATAEKSFGQRWNFFKQFGNHAPNQHLEIRACDYVSTSDSETAMIIEYHNPKIVLFGGLHRDLCVTRIKLAVQNDQREYHVSDQFSYSWRQTWQDG